MESKDFTRPTSNLIRVSKRKNIGFWVYLSKVYLKNFEKIELHALGDAITSAVRAAETLQRKGVCSLKKINTLTVALERRSRPEDQPEEQPKGTVKKHKVLLLFSKIWGVLSILQYLFI